MDMQGSRALAITPQQAWDALNDPQVLKACIEAYRPGVTSEDVQRHVAEVMKKKGLDARGQRGGIGHYVGLATHDVGPRGVPLQEGMVFAIEPMINMGKPGVKILPDKWTVVAADGLPSAHYEHTVLITENSAEILTHPPEKL